MINPPYPIHPEAIRKSWLERHPLWKIPVGCLVLLLLFAFFGITVFSIITVSFRNSEACRQALAKARENAQVRERLGEPITARWGVSGQLNVHGSTGDADLSIPIFGPHGKGVIRAVARKNGDWRFTRLEVDTEGQPGKIDLLSVQPPPERDF